LTKETIAELNRQLIEKDQQLDKKDQQLTQVLLEKAAKDKVIAEKDVIIAQKDEALAVVVSSKDKIISEKDRQLSEFQIEFRKFQKEFMESTKVALECMLGIGSYQFVLVNLSGYQECGFHGDWFSDPFSVSGCDLKLNVETKELGPNMKIRVCSISATDTFHRSIKFTATLLLLNQLSDHSHHFKKVYRREVNILNPTISLLSMYYTGRMQLFNIW
jgi:uncharacterized coiled-coil protein SlyX